MPAIPLYQTNPIPDAWHRVASPGGYESWDFEARDDQQDLQIVAGIAEGFVFHPQYLRRYWRYRRAPTRHRPPVPAEYPCAYFGVYQGGRVAAQFLSQYPAGDFQASERAPDVRLGPNHFFQEPDGRLRLQLRGVPWRATAAGGRREESHMLTGEFEFRPLLHHSPHECSFLSRRLSGATHQWVIANPLCEVRGVIHHYGQEGPTRPRVLELEGRGYHDHRYGTGPLGPGLRRWMRGTALLKDRAITFHFAKPRDAGVPDETHLIEADAAGLRETSVAEVTAKWSRRTGALLGYPLSLVFGDVLTLDHPRVMDSSPFRMRLTYDATCRGESGTALCEIAYPDRLSWPILGRILERSIHKPG